MRRVLFRTACFLYFGWLLADIASVVFTGHRIEGVYYLGASARLRHQMVDWTDTSNHLAPALFLGISALAWFGTVLIMRNQVGAQTEPAHEGAALILSISILPALWIVPSVTCGSYDLKLNTAWVWSMFFVNVVFFLYPLYRGFLRNYSTRYRDS